MPIDRDRVKALRESQPAPTWARLPKTIEELIRAARVSVNAGELVALYDAFLKKGAKVSSIERRWARAGRRKKEVWPWAKDPAKVAMMMKLSVAVAGARNLDPSTPLEGKFAKMLEDLETSL